jgi:hypothetical protein
MEQPLANFEVPTGNHNSPTKLFSETADTLLTAGGYQQGNGYMNEGRNSPLDLRTSTASAALNNTTAENDQHNKYYLLYYIRHIFLTSIFDNI